MRLSYGLAVFPLESSSHSPQSVFLSNRVRLTEVLYKKGFEFCSGSRFLTTKPQDIEPEKF